MTGVMRGLGPTVVRDAPAFGLYFYSYEIITRAMDPLGSANLPGYKLLLAGGAAGVISWVATYPIDVVKSRLQADGIYAHQRLYSGAMDCARKTLQNEGYKAMTQGLSSAIARAFVINGVTFWTVEWVYDMYKRFEEEEAAEAKKAKWGRRPAAYCSGPWTPHWNSYHRHLLPLPEAGATLIDPHLPL